MTGFLGSLLEISLVTSAVIGLVLLASPLLIKKYSVKSLCAVWLIISVRLIVPVTYHLPQPVIHIPVPVQSGAVLSPSAGHPAAPNDQSPPSMTTGPSKSSDNTNAPPGKLTVSYLLFIVWCTGALSVISARFIGYCLLKRSIRRFSKPIYSECTRKVFDAVIGDLKIPAGRVTAREFSKVQGPAMTGFFHPVILLPQASLYEVTGLELILRHELVHYKRRDIWRKLLLSLASAVHWFNPLVWLMVREANRQTENACDQEIVRGQDMALRKKYGESLLSAIARDRSKRLGLTTYFHGGKKTMTERFKNIFDQTKKKRGTAVVAAVLLLVLISGTLVACQASAGIEPSASPSASVSPPPSGSAAPSSPSSGDEEKVLELAKAWSEAVKNRDGKAQYDLYTTALQKKVFSAYEGLNWVTGVSSPWVESYSVQHTDSGATVTLTYATSTGSAGNYDVGLVFADEGGTLKISDITNITLILGDVPSPTDTSATAAPDFSFLISLLGMTKDQVTANISEKPVSVDEGGLGFDKTGIRVWFDTETYTKVAQVLIMTDQINIDGLKVGDSYKDFKAKFGEPISDQNGDAHFKYGDVYLSVVRDTSTDKTIAVYILAEDF